MRKRSEAGSPRRGLEIDELIETRDRFTNKLPASLEAALRARLMKQKSLLSKDDYLKVKRQGFTAEEQARRKAANTLASAPAPSPTPDMKRHSGRLIEGVPIDPGDMLREGFEHQKRMIGIGKKKKPATR